MRLFLGIRPPDEVIAHAVAIQDGLRPALTRQGVRFAAPAKMHLTLAFLGDAADPAEADVIAGKCLTDTGPLLLATRQVGAFPTLERPKVIWLGVDGVGLPRIAQALEVAFSCEHQPFHGHVTIARVSPGSKAVGRALAPFCESNIDSVSWVASSVDLVLSRPDGAYEALNQYFL